MEPIRVLHVIGRMDRGGAEAMIMNLYRVIDRAYVQFDFVEHIDHPAAYDEEIVALGGRIFRCPRFSGLNLISYRRWWNCFFDEHTSEYPIIHGHIGSTAAIYLSVAKKHGIFTIAHSHSSGTDHTMKSYAYQALAFPTRFIADWFFACSQAAAVDRFGRKVASSNRCAILPNAIDTAVYKYDSEVRAQKRTELGLNDSLVLLHVGRFDKAKNQAFLIPVLREALNLHTDIHLLLIGDGPERENVEHIARDLGLSDRVTFTGIRDDVSRLLQAADVLIFPSVFEGLPVTLIEAQCAGLPCVISDTIPPDCILTEGLVTQLNLNDDPAYWACKALSCTALSRTDRSDEIKARGFDTAEIARRLEEFYLEHYK